MTSYGEMVQIGLIYQPIQVDSNTLVLLCILFDKWRFPLGHSPHIFVFRVFVLSRVVLSVSL